MIDTYPSQVTRLLEVSFQSDESALDERASLPRSTVHSLSGF